MSATPPSSTRDPSPFEKSYDGGSHGLKFAQQAFSDWNKLQRLKQGSTIFVDGNSLDVTDIVAVAKYGTVPELTVSPVVQTQIEKSIETLHRHLRNGHVVYGVTTGFGGSADSRTTDTAKLQGGLIQHQNSGVLTRKDTGQEQVSDSFDDFDAKFDTQSMPTTWVRASMLVRCNSIVRGHSAVRAVIAESILALLKHEVTPIVPLRGSISASGDLSPLSYIAGAIEGNPDIYCRVGKGTGNIMTAEQALKKFNIEPVVLRAKEGLGILNGTAFSAATASLAIYQCQEIAILSQALTAMGVEAMAGTAESFFPRIAEMRPHRGQVEAAANIFSMLQKSKLAACVEGPKDTKMTGLYQDRYALRTSSQWIGPQLEDLHHAYEQLLVEINSTTDNPLVDVENDLILHGGNFQAAVVTSTMDRARLALEKLGRMLFAQATEIINTTTNKGLPSNLVSDDPSISSTCKGIDINMAAYASELAFLATPVGNHVMSAEMHNQSINSLALISSRYTFQALDTIYILCSAYLFMVTQALDLRVQQQRFLAAVRQKLQAHLKTSMSSLSCSELDDITTAAWLKFTEIWPQTSAHDLGDRCSKTMESLIPLLVITFAKGSYQSVDFSTLTEFTSSGTAMLKDTYRSVQIEIENDRLNIVSSYLGTASNALYTFIRSPAPAGLGIEHHKGLIEHPTQPVPEAWTDAEARNRKTIGSRISIIYEAMRAGRLGNVLMKIVGEKLRA